MGEVNHPKWFMLSIVLDMLDIRSCESFLVAVVVILIVIAVNSSSHNSSYYKQCKISKLCGY